MPTCAAPACPYEALTRRGFGGSRRRLPLALPALFLLLGATSCFAGSFSPSPHFDLTLTPQLGASTKGRTVDRFILHFTEHRRTS
ncbi:MAG: hypothetical protein ACRDJH_04155 [Thermomicrobiales bacterium]